MMYVVPLFHTFTATAASNVPSSGLGKKMALGPSTTLSLATISSSDWDSDLRLPASAAQYRLSCSPISPSLGAPLEAHRTASTASSMSGRESHNQSMGGA